MDIPETSTLVRELTVQPSSHIKEEVDSNSYNHESKNASDIRETCEGIHQTEEKSGAFPVILVKNQRVETENGDRALDSSAYCIIKVEAEQDDFDDADDSGVEDTDEKNTLSKRHDENMAESDSVDLSGTTFAKQDDKAVLQRSLQCEIYNRCFNDKSTLRMHKFIHDGKGYSCDEGVVHGKKPGILKVHKETHVDKGYSCDNCQKCFKYFKTLTHHMRTVHLGIKPYVCDKCGYRAADSSRLKRHLHEHDGLYFQCDICCAVLKAAGNFRRHMKKLHNKLLGSNFNPERYLQKVETTSPFICDVCDRSFKREDLLKRHFCLLRKGIDLNTCPVCEKSFSGITGLTKHMYQHSSGIRPFKCTECDKSYTAPGELRWHMAMHTQRKDFTCEFCNKSFPSAFHLRRHTYIHTAVKNHICTTCGERFSCQSRLLAHMVKHSNNKPHVCTICNKSYPRTKSLKRHMLLHGGHKPHLCATCGKSFAVKDALVSHRRSHSDEKPYCCDFCGKLFRHPSDLRRHRLTHSDNLPHECEICGKKCRLRSNLLKHMQTHASEDVKQENNQKRRQKRQRLKAARAKNISSNNKQHQIDALDFEKEYTFQMMPENFTEPNNSRVTDSGIKPLGEKNITVPEIVCTNKDDDDNAEKYDTIKGDINNINKCSHDDMERKESSLNEAKDRELIETESEGPTCLTAKEFENNNTTRVIVHDSRVNDNTFEVETNTSPDQNIDGKETSSQNLDEPKKTANKSELSYRIVKDDKDKKVILKMVQMSDVVTAGKSQQQINIEKPKLDRIHEPGKETNVEKSHSKQISKRRTNIDKSYQCKICSVNFRLYDTLFMHMVHVHDVDEDEAELLI